MIIRVTFDQTIIRHLEVLGNPKYICTRFKCLVTTGNVNHLGTVSAEDKNGQLPWMWS